MLYKIYRLVCTVVVSISACACVTPLIANAENNSTVLLSNKYFSLQFGSYGISSLKRINDSYDTDYISEGRELGDILLAYRVGSGEWRRISTGEIAEGTRIEADPSGVMYRVVCPYKETPAIDVRVSYQLAGTELQWRITCSNLTDRVVEIGDIGLLFPFNTRYTWDKETTLTRRVMRHSFVSGNGSFMFWLRCNSAGPYLVMTPRPGTGLKYFDLGSSGSGYRRQYCAYIHAAAAGPVAVAQGGSWRQPFTRVVLQPKGCTGDGASYGFDFTWAKDYEGVREVLYQNNGFDTVVTPGMTIPADMPAHISLRTKNRITAIEAEYPEQTTLDNHSGSGTNSYVYSARFSRLGENKLTVYCGSNQYMYLEFFVTEPLETIIKKRAAFLVNTHQHRNPSNWYNGVFADWNMESHTLLSPDNLDRVSTRQEYMITCDDPALGKAPYVATKNVDYPDTNEIAALEYYIDNFVWGGLQRTDSEEYPYGIYGIPHWKANRESSDPGKRGQLHIWRIYDYPHMILLYYRMYQIAALYPEIGLRHSKDDYLRRAYGTAIAFFTIPLAIEGWTAYKTGTYNELIINQLIEALHEAGWQDEEQNLRRHWEIKVQNFVKDRVNPFGSEYAFDTTGFESTHALAKYALARCLSEGTNYINAESGVTRSEAEGFMQQQIAYNIFCRGWLECAYYLYGSDYRGESSRYTLSYMSQMGGWAILDYGLYYADNPFPYLRLGYASTLSSWALLNSGTPESKYGYWYPGKENDGGAGGGFEAVARARNWLGQEQGRGAWYYSCEIDLGFNGSLRSLATILADDPLFGMTVLGGELVEQDNAWLVYPKDGLRRRFHIVTPERRIHLLLERDGFKKNEPVKISKDYSTITFTLENRWTHSHETMMELSGLDEGRCVIKVDGEMLRECTVGNEQSVKVIIPIDGKQANKRIEIEKIDTREGTKGT